MSDQDSAPAPAMESSAEPAPDAPADAADAPASERPAIAQESLFVVEESWAYKAMRTGAIWMNKLFFSSLALLGVWLLLALTGQVEPGCADSPEGETCSAILSTTSLYLGAMAILSFLLSIGFGLLGLVVGKNIIESTAVEDEVGARRDQDTG